MFSIPHQLQTMTNYSGTLKMREIGCIRRERCDVVVWYHPIVVVAECLVPVHVAPVRVPAACPKESIVARYKSTEINALVCDAA